MAHLFHSAHAHHPGTSHAGEVGFYTMIGVAGVGLVALLGTVMVVQNALTGLASLAVPFL